MLQIYLEKRRVRFVTSAGDAREKGENFIIETMRLLRNFCCFGCIDVSWAARMRRRYARVDSFVNVCLVLLFFCYRCRNDTASAVDKRKVGS